MTAFDENQHPRGHASNPGSFSEKSRSAPESALAARPPATVRINATAELETGYLEDLPAYPSDLPAPDVSWELSGSRVETFVLVGDRGITFWQNDAEEPFNSLEDPSWSGDSGDTDQALLDWGTALNARIADLQYGTQHAIFPQTQEAILHAALGRPALSED